jgi:hypothetical protein
VAGSRVFVRQGGRGRRGAGAIAIVIDRSWHRRARSPRSRAAPPSAHRTAKIARQVVHPSPLHRQEQGARFIFDPGPRRNRHPDTARVRIEARERVLIHQQREIGVALQKRRRAGGFPPARRCTCCKPAARPASQNGAVSPRISSCSLASERRDCAVGDTEPQADARARRCCCTGHRPGHGRTARDLIGDVFRTSRHSGRRHS